MLVLANRDDLATAHAALETGAHGFISRCAPTRVLFEALHLVLDGGVDIPPETLRAVAAPIRIRAASQANPEASAAASQNPIGLTPRQLDVMAHLVQGKPNMFIGRALDLREGAIKTHIVAIFRALGVVNRTGVVRRQRARGRVDRRCAEAVGSRGTRTPSTARCTFERVRNREPARSSRHRLARRGAPAPERVARSGSRNRPGGRCE